MKKTLFFLLFVCIGCQTITKSDSDFFLEDIRGEKALNWVQDKNKITEKKLHSYKDFEIFRDETKSILSNKERIPSVRFKGDYVYNHWTDEQNPRGIWRRTSLEDYKNKSPKWEVLLDIDALGKTENESWVFKGTEVFNDKALVFLSKKGKDALVLREFDLKQKIFVKDGFNFNESKLSAIWIDQDTLLIAANFGADTMTKSGYPRELRLWKRGQDVLKSSSIIKIPDDHMGLWVSSIEDTKLNHFLISSKENFYKGTYYLWNTKQSLVKVNIPDDAEIEGIHNNKIYYLIKSPLKKGRNDLLEGTLLSLPLASTNLNISSHKVEFRPTKNLFYSGISFSKSKVFLNLLNTVSPSIFELQSNGKLSPLNLPQIGNSSFMSGNVKKDELLLTYSNFYQPPSLYLWTNKNLTLIKSGPEFFNSKDIIVDQSWAQSLDGTKIPYFIVRSSKTLKNSSNPTLLYGYGGFEIPLVPSYSGTIGKLWLERGGIYVLANIRGGGEFGPAWHKAALKENRHKAFEDFFAIAKDLVSNQWTDPQHLGIWGGSNGGLLMGVAYTQKPELFGAVLCEVPLLDMERYHKLLAGSSWVAEYGNPDSPKEKENLLTYSPYQNVKQDGKYPPIFITTSTEDDRVHPGHARRMAYKLDSMGHRFLYFENTEGGHGRTADLNQASEFIAKQYSFLWGRLGR